MSLWFYLSQVQEIDVYDRNITHNLGPLAEKAGIYLALWHPDRINAVYAKDIIPILEEGLKKLKSDPEYYQRFNSPNGWGTYEHFVPFVEEVLLACKEYPDAKIRTST